MISDTKLTVTHISNNLDLLVLHLVEDICVAEGLHERRPYFDLLVKELDKVLQLRTSFLKVLGEFLSSCLICTNQECKGDF